MADETNLAALHNGYSSELVASEVQLAVALRAYLRNRMTDNAPLDDLADEALGAVNAAMKGQYGFKVEMNQ